ALPSTVSLRDVSVGASRSGASSPQPPRQASINDKTAARADRCFIGGPLQREGRPSDTTARPKNGRWCRRCPPLSVAPPIISGVTGHVKQRVDPPCFLAPSIDVQ